MKLSDAILKGIEQFPIQAKEEYFILGDGKRCACALGCAIYATFDVIQDIDYSELLEEYPELDITTKHPEADSVDTLYSLIVILNDYHNYSREQIAAWLVEQGY